MPVDRMETYKDGQLISTVLQAIPEDEHELRTMRVPTGVRPIIMFPNDTPTDRRYVNGTAWAFSQLQQWWKSQIGLTFNLLRPYVHRTHLNANEIVGQHLVPIFNTAMEECGNPSNQHVVYYMVNVLDTLALGTGANYAASMFATKGRWWNRTVWQPDGPNVDFAFPGRSWLGGAQVHILAGYDPIAKFGYQTTDPNAPKYERAERLTWECTVGGMAHELAHCWAVPDGGPTTIDRIMFAYGDWPYAGFTHAEIQILRRSPFLR